MEPSLHLVPPASLELFLTITDREILAELLRHEDPDERERHAMAALRVGILALRSASGVLDEQAIRATGQQMVREMEVSLARYQQRVTGEIATSLETYFDQRSGTVPQMLEGLVRRDGVLDALLRSHLDGDRSTLAQTLVHHVGDHSPLLRLLSPEQKDGLLSRLEELVRGSLEEQRGLILHEFDLNDEGSALSRLVHQVRQGHVSLQAAVAEMVARLAREFSMDHEGSALVRFRRELGGLVENLAAGQRAFQERVLAEIEGLKSRREVERFTPRKGFGFQRELGEFLRIEAEKLGEVLQDTSAQTGAIKHCKRGDFVLEFGPDSGAPGERIVVEAKESVGYSVKDALEEMREARPNRGAQHGIFVFARGSAPEGMPPLRRFGEDVLVAWDAGDPSSDVWLRAGLEIARALTVRRARRACADAAGFEDMERLIAQMEKDAGSLDSILSCAGSITVSSERIREEARKLQKKLGDRLTELQETVAALRSSAAN